MDTFLSLVPYAGIVLVVIGVIWVIIAVIIDGLEHRP